MTYGSYFHTIDAKNRFFIPAQLRDELGTKIVLFKSPDEGHCIYLYTEERWDEICADIYDLPPSPESRRRQRALLHAAIPVELDKSGRITLNQGFKEFANIEKDIVIVGAARRIEIWSAEDWAKEEEYFDDCISGETEVRF